MATTIQHKPVSLQQNQQTEDDDVALATYLSGSLRFDHHHQVIFFSFFFPSTPFYY